MERGAMTRGQASGGFGKGLWLVLLAWLMLGMGMAHAATTTTVTYVYTNAQGTPLAEADAQGNIIARYSYRPYGTQQSGPTNRGPGYTGHVHDPDTGLVYMQQRYYDPAIGRFISPDPIVPTPGNVFNFGRYTYANDNPIRFTDPSGMCSKHQTEHIDKNDSASEKLCARAERTRRGDAGGLMIDPSHMTSLLILHNVVTVNYSGNISFSDQLAMDEKLRGAAGIIDAHAGQFTLYDKKKYHNIKAIQVSVDGWIGIFWRSGTLALTTGYIRSSTPTWLATAIAHDGFHVFQFSQRGKIYNRQTAPRLEHRANVFQAHIGRILGLPPSKIQYILTDTHTAYNDVH